MRAPLRPIASAVVITAIVGTGYFYLKKGGFSSLQQPQNKIERTHTKPDSSPSNNKPEIGPAGNIAWTELEPAYKNYKIQIGNDTSLQVDNQTLELYGIKILPRSQICAYRSGERWACGQRAYIALINIMGSTTIDCRPRDVINPRVVVCHLGGADISELMLREGWGHLADGVTERKYIDAANAAIARETGMWSLQPAQRSAYQLR